jgi:hypothetical protein
VQASVEKLARISLATNGLMLVQIPRQTTDEKAMPPPSRDRWSEAALSGIGKGGERLVFYEYCISLIFITLRRPSRVVRLPPGSTGLLRGLPYTIISLLLGWWGLPWGLLYTPLTLWTNLTGGREISSQEWECWTAGRPCRE